MELLKPRDVDFVGATADSVPADVGVPGEDVGSIGEDVDVVGAIVDCVAGDAGVVGESVGAVLAA